MSQSVGGGLSAAELFDEEEVDVDSVIGTMTIAKTVSRTSRSPEGSAEISIGKPTVKMAADTIQELLADQQKFDRATTQIDSDKLRALGVIHAGEKKQAVVEAAPPQLSKATWSEHPPAVSIAVDRGYESSLAKKQLAVTHEGEEEGVTTPIQVVHEQLLAQLTMPIPRSNVPAMLHAIAVAAPVTRKTSHAWMGFAMGAAVGILAVVGFAVGVL
jgi:hypothetical protein